MSRPRRRSTLSLLGAFLTLLAGAFVATGEARAGCSHYVQSKAQHVAAKSLNALEILVDPSSSLVLDLAVPADRQDCPCNGPTCSGKPSRPDLPGVSVPKTLDRWCDLASALNLLGQETSRLVQPDDSARPHSIPSSLERPPRSV